MKTPVITPTNHPLSRLRPLNLARKLNFSFGVLCASLVTASPVLHAANVYWTAPSGTWFTPNGWFDAATAGSPRNAPDAADGAFITGNITLAGVSATTALGVLGNDSSTAGTLNIDSGGAWLTTATNGLIIGKAGTGVLNVATGGTLGNTNSAATTYFGYDVGSSGTATIFGTWQTAGPLYIGNAGEGTLIVETGGTVNSAGSSRIGFDSTGTGSAIIRGYWNNASTLVVGGTGNGTLEIASTGTVISGNFYGADYDGSMAKITVNGYMQSTQAVIGQRGTAIVDILSGGTMLTTGATHILLGNTANGVGTINVKDGAYLYASNQIRVGNVASGTGFLNIESGATVRTASGVYASLGNGYGVVNIATGGTLIIDANALYVGNGGATNNNTYGEVNINGYFQSGGNGTYYTPVGYAGMGVLRLGDTGTAKSGALDIGREATATGTVTIAGRWEILGSAGETMVGNAGKGTLIIEDGGFLGYMDTRNYLRIGNAANATGYLYIAPTGTLFSGGARLTYTNHSATARVEVDGRWDLTGYIIVAHYGNSYMTVGTTGTVTASDYISIGQGDSYGKTDANAPPADYLTAYSGTLRVEGFVSTNNYLRVANRLTGVLDITTTGTVISAGEVRISENATIASTGTAIVAGYLKAGTNFKMGVNSMNTGILDIKKAGQVVVGGAYFQNARSTLLVELDPSRNADTIDPLLTSPFITADGVATLSGTLRVYGAGVSEISYTGGGEGKATELTGIPILRAAGGVTGDFDMVKIDGVSTTGLPDYIRSGGMKVNEGGPVDTRYDVGFGLAWRSGADHAHGTFTVEGGKTFDVDVQLTNRSGISFDTGWDGSSLTKRGPGTLILSVQNAYTGVTTVESGTLRFAGPTQHNIKALVNNGVVDFYATDSYGRRIGDFRTVNITSLAGNGSYHMGVDIAAGTSDHLVIDGDATGNHRILITGGGAMPIGDEPMPTLVTIGGVNDIDYTAGGQVIDNNGNISTFEGNFDYGNFNYKVEMRGNRIVIANTGLLPAAYDPIRGVPGSQSLLWFDQQDNISRRLGELRAPREKGTGFDIWARGHAASASIGGGSTEMRKSDVDIWGLEMGSDYTWKFDDQRATLGIFFGCGNASQDFDLVINASKATGDSDLLGMGVYGAWLTDSGWFVNATASLAQFKNSFDSVDLSNNHTTGDYKDHAFGVSAEGGRRFAISAKGWFIEPAIQGAVARLTRGDYLTSSTGDARLSVHGADATITRLRGTIRVGRAWKTERTGWWEIAGRFAATNERSTGGEINIGSANRWRPNLDGERYEAGVGVFWQPFASGQFYFDYEYASGDNFEKPWGISLGLRFSL